MNLTAQNPIPFQNSTPLQNLSAIFRRGLCVILLVAGSVPLMAVGSADQMPMAITQAAPASPADRTQRASATVSFLVEPDGHVSDATIIDTTSKEYGEAVRQAALTWTYTPGRRNGKSVQMRVFQTLSLSPGPRQSFTRTPLPETSPAQTPAATERIYQALRTFLQDNSLSFALEPGKAQFPKCPPLLEKFRVMKRTSLVKFFETRRNELGAELRSEIINMDDVDGAPSVTLKVYTSVPSESGNLRVYQIIYFRFSNFGKLKAVEWGPRPWEKI